MITLKNKTLKEIAAIVSSHLKADGISVVLVGGACVSIYTDNQYQTKDLDFVELYDSKRKELKASLLKLGFTENRRYFVHPDTDYFVEFPSGPVSVGDEPIHSYHTLGTSFGTLVLLTATDICKDRLAAYLYWSDRQALEQALNIAKDNDVDIENIKDWARREKAEVELNGFFACLER